MNTGNKTRLLFVAENERYGGGERAFAELIKGLDKSCFDIYVACQTELPGAKAFVKEVSRQAQVIPLDMRHLLNFSIATKLKGIISEYSIDLVHSQGPRPDFYCRVALQDSEVAHVCTVASPVEEYDVNLFKKALYIAADRYLASSVDKYIAVAGHIADKLKERGLEEECVRVIYNGVDTEIYAANREAAAKARAGMGVGEGDFLVSAFCRLSAEKGVADLVDAAAMTLGLGIKYVVAGTGPLEGELREKISGLGLEKDFILAGFMADVRPLLWASDLVALPSHREGFPMSALEAMAASKPVLASKIAGVDESVEDGVTGLLVPQGDGEAFSRAIKSLSADRARASAMGESGRLSVTARFGLDRMVRDHEKIYKELAA